MGVSDEETDQSITPNGSIGIPNSSIGGEVTRHRVNGNRIDNGTLRRQCQGISTLKTEASTQTLVSGPSNVGSYMYIQTFDPVYYGIISCPRSPENFYTLTAINMCALLKLYDERVGYIRRNPIRRRSYPF